MNSIYLIHDTGYEMGVKLGYIADGTGKAAWRAVPSYSPRPMRIDGIWNIPARFFLPEISQRQSKERLERSLHGLLGGPMNRRPEFPRTGRDWCWAKVEEAVDLVSSFIGSAPSLAAPNYSLPINDNFRNPHPKNLATHPHKVVLWLYRERITGRLKTQFIDDWRTPFENARRYSRNGIEEVSAFSYLGRPTTQGNLSVLDTWTRIVTTFGFGPADTNYGWLREGATLHDIEALARGHLQAVQVVSTTIPEGVKAAYNT